MEIQYTNDIVKKSVCPGLSGLRFSNHSGSGLEFLDHSGSGLRFSNHSGSGLEFLDHSGSGLEFLDHSGSGLRFKFIATLINYKANNTLRNALQCKWDLF